jgi:hypothetical protein
MRQFVNSVDILLAESLDGFATAHADIIYSAASASRNGLVPHSPDDALICTASTPIQI